MLGVSPIMSGMCALVRHISPYTGPDLLLGVFLSHPDAETARLAYCERYSRTPERDPWHEQAYKEPGLASDDLAIIDVPSCPSCGDRPGGATSVYIVSSYAEAVGQSLRTLESVHAAAGCADGHVARLEQQELSDAAMSADVQCVAVGALLSDAPEDQP